MDFFFHFTSIEATMEHDEPIGTVAVLPPVFKDGQMNFQGPFLIIKCNNFDFEPTLRLGLEILTSVQKFTSELSSTFY